MIGLVLCGGRSTRMGQDKGLLQTQSRAWAQSTVEILGSICSNTLVSVNQDQYAEYAKQFSAEQLVIDDENLGIKGPLTGLMTAHEKFKADDIAVLPCDLPNMSTDVLEYLRDMYDFNPEFEAWVFKNEDQIEPVCAIYSDKGLSTILSAIRNNSLGRFSMHHVLELLQVLYIPVPEKWKLCFENFNTHNDLNSLK